MIIEDHVDTLGNMNYKKIWEASDFLLAEKVPPQTGLAYKLNNEINGGYYVEIGAGSPIENNHTYYLENNYDWKGVSIEINEKLTADFNKVRKNKCINEDALTFNWQKYFEENNFPNEINFLSIDIDQMSGQYANNHALINLPLTKYRFKIISIEHNFGTDFRSENILRMQRDILLSFNYSLLIRGRNDDIWIDELKFNSINGYDSITGIKDLNV